MEGFGDTFHALFREIYRAVIAGRAPADPVYASFLDGLLLGAFLPGEPIFAVDTYIAKNGGRSPSSPSCGRSLTRSWS